MRLGLLLGALDARSRRVISGLLKDLAETPDDREDIAWRVVANAQVSNDVLNKKIKCAPPNAGARGRSS